MADWYVYSGAGGTADGTSWANAYTTLQAVLTSKTGGDVAYVAHDHVQTQATALSITGLASDGAPHRVYCVNRSGSVPPVAADLRTTAQVSTTGASSITLNDSISEMYGIILSAGDAANGAGILVGSAGSKSCRMINCQLKLNNTNAGSRINLGSNTTLMFLENTTCTFGAVGQGIGMAARVIIRGPTTAFVLGTAPTVLFLTTASTNTLTALIEGVDLSAVGSGKALVNAAGTSSMASRTVFKDCKLGASVGITSGAYAGPGLNDIILVNCDSGDTNYRTERHNFSGVQTIETTIVRTGGASDGTTGIAWKIVTNAGAAGWPFESIPISVWNETVGSSITVAIEGIWGSGVVPTNAQIWIDVFYPGTSSSNTATRATSGNTTLLHTGTNIPAGSGTWGGSTTKFVMSVSITPQEKGPITIYVMAGAASSTFYIDPEPVVT